MKKDALISIIIPVYNTGEYLYKCLDSILNSTYQNLEIIVINNGSDDPVTNRILDEYAKKDERISYYRKDNEGIAKTRNFGLDHLKGEYVMFVDSDDFIDRDMIQKMYETIINKDVDIVECAFVIEKGPFKICRKRYKDHFYDNHETLKGLEINTGINNYLWAKLYRSILFEGVRFKEDYRGFEDVEIMPRIFAKSKGLYTLKQRFYHYVMRRGSYTNHMTYKISDEMFKAFKAQEDYLNTLDEYVYSNYQQLYRSEMMKIYVLLFHEKGAVDYVFEEYDDSKIPFILKKVRDLGKSLVDLKYRRKR